MIDSFRDKHFFLSNFFPCKVVYEAIEYPSSEHAFQASKTLIVETRMYMAGLKTASEAKKVGRKINVRDDWESVKLKVMEDVVRSKFTDPRNSDIKKALIDTGDKMLVELNDWNDVFWGVSASTGKGENHLGKILMKIRKELSETC